MLGAVFIRGVDGTYGVNHPAGREVSRCRRHRLPDQQPCAVSGGVQLPEFSKDRRPAAPMDGPADTTTAHKRGAGSVDDGIHVLLGNVALNDMNPHAR
jgi:hypothetical protein